MTYGGSRYNFQRLLTTQEEINQAEEELKSRTKLYSLDDMVVALDAVKRRVEFEAERKVNAEIDRLRLENKPKEANYDDRFTRAWLHEKTELGKAEARIKELETALAALSKPKKTKKPAPKKKKPTRKKKA